MEGRPAGDVVAGAARTGRGPQDCGPRQQTTRALRAGPQVPRSARDFSIEQGEVTATMKVRRTQAMENFKDHIDELYAGRE